MADTFTSQAVSLESPAFHVVAITAADADLATDVRALYVGTGGNVKITTSGGTTATFANVPSGTLLPVRCRRVWTTGTTATDFTGLY